MRLKLLSTFISKTNTMAEQKNNVKDTQYKYLNVRKD